MFSPDVYKIMHSFAHHINAICKSIHFKMPSYIDNPVTDSL
jgi:hypothetical protein